MSGQISDVFAQFRNRNPARSKSQGSGWNTVLSHHAKAHFPEQISLSPFSYTPCSIHSYVMRWFLLGMKLRKEEWMSSSPVAVKEIHKTVQKLFVPTAWNSTVVGNTSVKGCLEQWTKDWDVCSTGRIVVRLRRILERQVFSTPFNFASNVMSRETANHLPSHMLVKRLASK